MSIRVSSDESLKTALTTLPINVYLGTVLYIVPNFRNAPEFSSGK